MELLTIGIQASVLLWGAALTYLGVREIHRALAARRRRLIFWRDLLRSAHEATAHLPPLPERRP